MLGEFSNADGRGRAPARAMVVVPSGARRGVVAGLQRRARGRDDIPASGQIVFRSVNQILR
jgi:hypothetical protein